MVQYKKIVIIAGVLVIMAGAAAFLLRGYSPPEDDGQETEKKVKIVFEDEHIASSHSESVHIDGNRVTIRAAGTYVLRGRLSDGQVIVDAGPEDEVTIKLNGLSAHCSDSAPLWIKRAGKVKIRLKDDSENILSDGPYYRDLATAEKKAGACIDARCDLSIRGDKGSLKIEASYRDGIYSSDDLKIKSGNIDVTAERDALYGKDSVQVEEGKINIHAGRDGIHSDGETDIAGGELAVRASRYGLYAFSELKTGSPARAAVGSARSTCGCAGTVSLESEIGSLPDEEASAKRQ